MCRDGVVQGVIVFGVSGLQGVLDVILQLSGLEEVGHESGCELAGSATGAGCAATSLEMCQSETGNERKGGVEER